MGQILGQNGVWGTVWGNIMSAFVRICPHLSRSQPRYIIENMADH